MTCVNSTHGRHSEELATLLHIHMKEGNFSLSYYCFPYDHISETNHNWLLKNSFKKVTENEIVQNICNELAIHEKSLMAISFEVPTIRSQYYLISNDRVSNACIS